MNGRVHLRHVLAIRITDGPHESPEFIDAGVPFLSVDNFVDGRLRFENCRFISEIDQERFSRKARPQRGDVLITKAASVGKVALVDTDREFNVWSPIAIMRPRLDAIDPVFLYHFLQSSDAQGQLVRGSSSNTQQNIAMGDIAALEVPLLEIRAQRAIADYLDTETARIDALITKKQRMIDASRERQVASESAAVLAAGGQTTPIPTIPTVPAGWRVLRNKVFMREVNKPSLDGAEEMLSVSHLTGVTPRSEKTVNMFEAESTVGYKRVESGDLVINTMWAWMGAAGVARVPGIVSPAYGVYRIDPTIMTPDYFDIVVRTVSYITEMTRYSRGVTSSRLRLYPEEFLGLSSPVPPLEEQRRIVDRCFAARTRTVTLVERLERQIGLLREHRQALITAAVTGELDIPGVAA